MQMVRPVTFFLLPPLKSMLTHGNYMHKQGISTYDKFVLVIYPLHGTFYCLTPPQTKQKLHCCKNPG
jgi:hypothetical protein